MSVIQKVTTSKMGVIGGGLLVLLNMKSAEGMKCFGRGSSISRPQYVLQSALVQPALMKTEQEQDDGEDSTQSSLLQIRRGIFSEFNKGDFVWMGKEKKIGVVTDVIFHQFGTNAYKYKVCELGAERTMTSDDLKNATFSQQEQQQQQVLIRQNADRRLRLKLQLRRLQKPPNCRLRATACRTR